jgi:hypothetical protein
MNNWLKSLIEKEVVTESNTSPVIGVTKSFGKNTTPDNTEFSKTLITQALLKGVNLI